MMDVETIGVGVDATGVDKGAAALDKFGTAADKASGKADDLEKKLDKTTEAAEKMGVKIGNMAAVGIGAAITAAIGAAVAVDALINKVAKYQDLADRTGGSAEGIASMRTAADVAGVSIDNVAGAMSRMNRILAGVDDESKGAGRAIKALGLDLDDFKKKSPDEQLRSVAKALGEFKDIGGGKSAILQAITGRGGSEMLGFMKELEGEQERNIYLTNQQIEAADEYADANARTRSQITQLAEAASVLALPAFNAFTTTLIEATTELLGLGTGADALAGNTSVNDFAVIAVRALGRLITAAEMVQRTFEALGTMLGGVAAAGAAVLSGEFKNARNIIGMLDADLKKIESRPFFSQKLEERLKVIGTGQEAIAIAAEKARNDRKASEAREAGKKSLAFSTAKPRGAGGGGGREAVDPLDAILKGIRSRTSEMALELAMGEKLTAGQRQAAKVMEDLRTGTLKLTQAKTLLLTKSLEEMLVAENDLASKKRQADMLKSMLDEAQQNRDDADADLKSRGDAFNSAARSMSVFVAGVKQANDATQYEISLMDVSEGKREKMLAQYRLQIEYENRLTEIDAMNIDPEQRGALKTGAAKGYQAQIDGTGANELLNSMKELDSYFDPTKVQSFGEALQGTFGAAGNAFAQLSNVLDSYALKQAELNKQRQHAIVIEEAAGDAFAKGDVLEGLNLQAKANKANRQIETARSKSQIQNYSDMAGAMKGFFDENSRGYKALEIVQAAFQVAQAVSNLAMGTSAAAVGVATQAQGDPYTAWARMAAMVAAMASLGFAIKGAGGGSAPSTLAADRQRVTGTGSVLGDASAKSESITNSLKMIEDSAQAGLRYQSGMLTSLRSIDNNMSGLAIMLLKASGITGNYNGPSQMGTQSKGWWGKNVTSLIDKGVTFQMQQLQDILQGNLQGQTYSDIETTSSSWFGLVKKTSRRRESGDLDPEIEKQFARVIANIVDTTRNATGALGQSAEDFNARMQGVQVRLGTLSFKGLTGKQIEEQLSAAFSAISDGIARIALPAVEQFQRIGEGLFETVVRVSVGVENATNALAMLGLEAISYTSIVNKQRDVASEIFRQTVINNEALTGSAAVIAAYLEGVTGGLSDLVDAYKELIGIRKAMVAVGAGFWQPQDLVRGAGGMEELQSGLASYFENFFNDAEQNAARVSQLNQDIAAAGESPIENSVAGFRARMASIDLSTNAGQERFGRLLSMADQFYEVVKVQEDALKQTLEAHTEYARGLRAFRNGLILGQLSPLAPTAKTSVAEGLFDSVLQKARGGDAEAQRGLTGASSAYLEALKNSSTSAVDYAVGFAKVQTALTLEAVRADSIAAQQLTHLSSMDATLQAMRQALSDGNVAYAAIAMNTFETSKAVRELRDLQVQAQP